MTLKDRDGCKSRSDSKSMAERSDIEKQTKLDTVVTQINTDFSMATHQF